MVAPLHYWMQPPVAERAGFVASLRANATARAVAIGWLVVAAVSAWTTANDAWAGQPWYVRLLVVPLGLYFLFGAVYAITLFVPSSQVRLEPDAVSETFGKNRTVHPLADIATYRLVDRGRWRSLVLAKVDGTPIEWDVPLRIAPDVIHRYFAERGVPEADPTPPDDRAP